MIIKEIQKLLPKGAEVFRGIYGDYSTNLAMVKKINPDKLVDKLKKEKIFKKVLSENGFINFYLSDNYLTKIFPKIKAPKLGKDKIMIEFISANPTGPLHIGNGRGAFTGDCLANVLEKVGYKIFREYYINDVGKQIEDLAKGVYKGETRTAQQIQEDNQKFIEQKLKIKFNNWFKESELDRTKNPLSKYSYKKENAVWLKTSKFGDDKDRVLIRKNGEPTYILSDILYHQDKIKRKYNKLIDILGADHHGYIGRLQAVMEMLGAKGKLDIIITQLVNIKGFKLSKRAGRIITLEQLVDEVGLDVTRFFFLLYDYKTHMDFDLDLAKEQSQKNPVYYVQYAYARISSILEKARDNKKETLSKPEEFELIKQLLKYPEILEDITKTYSVHKLPHYSIELAKTFHNFYHKCRVIGGGKERLELVKKTKEILGEVLGLMGIESPEKM